MDITSSQTFFNFQKETRGALRKHIERMYDTVPKINVKYICTVI